MLKIGVQSKNVVYDEHPLEGFALLKSTGFECTDFSLNSYLTNTDLYNHSLNGFFDKSVVELEEFFAPHKNAAKTVGIDINQMHMPYPLFVPGASAESNSYVQGTVAIKSLAVCNFFDCHNIVVHGFKLVEQLGLEENEWEETEKFLDTLAPIAREMKITLCIENLYRNIGTHLIEGPCCDAKKASERIDSFNEKYQAEVLGFCFDTGHANIVGLDAESFISELGDRLKVLHIHDNDGIQDLHQIPFTFSKTRDNKASTDWNGFLRGLSNVNFGGVLNFETAPALSVTPVELKTDALSYISKIGNYFREQLK